jgi:anti-anti-sigma factor
MEREMFTAQTIEMDDAVIVQCTGRLVRSEAAYCLRDAVRANRGCRSIVLDLSEVEAVGGGGLGMLAFLQRWAEDNGICMKLLNPSPRVQRRLKQLEFECSCEFEVERDGNVLHLIGLPDRKYWVASSFAA